MHKNEQKNKFDQMYGFDQICFFLFCGSQPKQNLI